MRRFGLLAVGLAVAASGQISKVPGGFLLRVRYAKGQVIRSTMTNTLIGLSSANGKPLNLSIPVTLRVLDVKGRESKVEIALGAVHLGKNSVYPGAKVIATVNDRNQSNGEASGVPGAMQFPAKAIRPGETWVSKTPISGATGMGMVDATYRFIGVRLSGTAPVAVVRFTINGTAQGSGEETLLLRDGTVFSSVSDLKMGSLKVHSVLRRA